MRRICRFYIPMMISNTPLASAITFEIGSLLMSPGAYYFIDDGSLVFAILIL